MEPGEFDLAAPALLDLRPRLGTLETVQTELARQATEGYRLVAAFIDDHPDAATVAGFRLGRNLPWGSYCYVDDLTTLPQFRGRGGGSAVLQRVIDIASDAGCESFHLDSGAGPTRYDAHALYYRTGLRITSHHFVLPLTGRIRT